MRRRRSGCGSMFVGVVGWALIFYGIAADRWLIVPLVVILEGLAFAARHQARAGRNGLATRGLPLYPKRKR